MGSPTGREVFAVEDATTLAEALVCSFIWEGSRVEPAVDGPLKRAAPQPRQAAPVAMGLACRVMRRMVKAKVLFVCVENSCRSQMAEGLARLRAAEVLEPMSAGSRPSGQVDPSAVQVMFEIGYDLTPHHSKSLPTIAADRFEYVVTMGCGDECPFIPADHHEDWDIPDPKGKPLGTYREVRRVIEDRVRDLAERVRRGDPR